MDAIPNLYIPSIIIYHTKAGLYEGGAVPAIVKSKAEVVSE
jgi:hypothetical protein